MLQSPLLALLGALALQEPVAAPLQDIPPEYHGRWALTAEACKEPGPALVQVTAREVRFYEEQAYLQLARLNYADTPPIITGLFARDRLAKFDFVQLRLEIKAGKLVITERKVGEDFLTDNPYGWIRCPSLGGAQEGIGAAK